MPALIKHSYLRDSFLELNWKNVDFANENSFPPVNWAALQKYAINLKKAQQGVLTTICTLRPEYNMGGLHLVRLLEFNDSSKWVARIQLGTCTAESTKRLLHEVHTLSLVRERSRIPVPQVYGYESTDKNAVGAAFFLLEFIPGNTAMDAFGGWDFHGGEIPQEHRPKFYCETAAIQVLRASEILGDRD